GLKKTTRPSPETPPVPRREVHVCGDFYFTPRAMGRRLIRHPCRNRPTRSARCSIVRRLVERHVVRRLIARRARYVAHAEPDGLAVCTFERLETHRMIGGRPGHRQDLRRSSCLSGRGAKQNEELFGGEQARTRAGEEQSTGGDAAHRQYVEVEILPFSRSDV